MSNGLQITPLHENSTTHTFLPKASKLRLQTACLIPITLASLTPKDEGDNEEPMVRLDLKATPGIREQMDPPVLEVYKARSDLPDHRDRKARQDLEAFKARQDLEAFKVQKAQLEDLLEIQAIILKEDRPSKKKLKLPIFQNLTALRRPLEPGCLKEIIGIATARLDDGVNP